MSTIFHQFLLCFIPLLVAIDVLSVVPLFLTITEKLQEEQRNRLITRASLVALIIAVVFLIAGRLLFKFLGITEDDFRIGGGILLLVLSITDLLFSGKEESTRSPQESEGLAIVPLGIPLIIGPTALTTILILLDSFGFTFTLLSLLLNILIVWIVFRYSKWILRIVGQGGTQAFAKVSSLFMTAIAVMMIRIGLTNILAGLH